jgi:hypothetical protein
VRDPDGFTKAARAAALVTQMTVITALGGWFGAYLDGRFATEPWLFFAGLASGFAIGMLAMFKGLTGLRPPDDQQPPDPPK